MCKILYTVPFRGSEDPAVRHTCCCGLDTQSLSAAASICSGSSGAPGRACVQSHRSHTSVVGSWLIRQALLCCRYYVAHAGQQVLLEVCRTVIWGKLSLVLILLGRLRIAAALAKISSFSCLY